MRSRGGGSPGLVLAFLMASGPAAAAEGWGPWQDEWAPYDDVKAAAPAAAPRSGLFESLYRFYRQRVSSRDGARCPYYPTCSGYAITAIRTHGPLVGSLYTVDRLLREYPGMDHVDHYPLVTPHDTPRLYDPVPVPRRDRD